MKKRYLRSLVVLCLCVMMSVSFSACTTPTTAPTTSAPPTNTSDNTPSATAPITDTTNDTPSNEPITLKVIGEVSSDGFSTDDAIGRYIQEKLGITLEYTVASGDKLKVMAAGGDLPDIVELFESPSLAKNLIDANSLYPLDDLLDSHGENIKKYVSLGLKWSKEVIGNGTTYIIPVSVEAEDKNNPLRNAFVGFFTRWDVYKELGCPEINNEDDYINVLKQMMDLHPTTQDGRKIYAISAWTDWGLWPYTISYPFSHGYTNIDNNQLMNHVTGEIEDMFIKEDGVFWKGISFFNKAYRAGIMDPEAFTMKDAQYGDKVKNGELLVAAAYWHQPDANIISDNAGLFVLPGAFPYISNIYPLDAPLGYAATNALAISANCKYPERAMQLLDYVNSDEGARLIRTGILGEDWDMINGTPELIGKRLVNFQSNNTEEVDYAQRSNTQGIGKYFWLTSRSASNPAADGFPLDLTLASKYTIGGITPAESDFAKYYGGDSAQYPGEAYVKLVDEGKMKTVENQSIAGKLMEPVSDDSAKVFAKADEYFQANISYIVMAENDEAFAEQKAKMISDIKAMGYEAALAEVTASFEAAKATLERFS